jgi:hypothetical protein
MRLTINSVDSGCDFVSLVFLELKGFEEVNKYGCSHLHQYY